MFVVTDADAAAIRAAFEQRGEFAAVELRRRFPGITDNAKAQECLHHRELEAAAAAAGKADAAVTSGLLMFRLRLPALAQSSQRGSASSHRD